MISNKRLTSKLLLAGLAIFAISLLAACGGDDEPASSDAGASANSTSSGVTSQSISSDEVVNDEQAVAPADLTTATEKDPPEVAVVPIEIPEPGSIEEKVLQALEKQVSAINTRDWASYQEGCQPNRLVRSIKEIKFTFEEFGGEFGFEIPSFSIDGYNARNVELTIYSGENARTTFDIYDYDQWVSTGVSRTWVNVEGEWYNDGLTCRGIGGG